MNISFARATASDVERLVQIQIAAFHHDSVLYPEVEASGPQGYDSVTVMLEKITHDETFTIVDGDVCIGGMVVFDQGAGHYHLDVIVIDPAYHNQGIGTQAMHFLEKTFPQARLWTLDTPVYAMRNHHFYEKLGYVRVREYDIDGFGLYAYEKHPHGPPRIMDSQ